jgi:predicted PurR-regulated permease PerM
MQRQTKIEQYGLILALIALFGFVVGSLLEPVILGLLIAMTLEPAMTWLTKHSKLPKALSSLLLTVGFIALVIAPLVYVGWSISGDLRALAQRLASSETVQDFQHGNSQDLYSAVNRVLEKISAYVPVPVSEIQAALKTAVASIATFIVEQLTHFAGKVPVFLLDFLLFSLTVFFALMDGPRWASTLFRVLPFRNEDTHVFFGVVRSITKGTILGSLAVGLVQGAIIGAAYFALDVPRPLFFALVTLLCSFVPFLGAGPTGLGGAIYLFANDSPGAGIAMLVTLAIAATSDNIVRPLLLKGEASMHPLLGLLSVIGGIAFFGAMGLFLGPIVAALMMATIAMLDNSGIDAA